MNTAEKKKARRENRKAKQVEVFIPDDQRPSWDIRSVGKAHGKSFRVPSFIGEAKREGLLSEKKHKLICEVLLKFQMGQKKYLPNKHLRELVNDGMLRESEDRYFYLVHDTREWDIGDVSPEMEWNNPIELSDGPEVDAFETNGFIEGN